MVLLWACLLGRLTRSIGGPLLQHRSGAVLRTIVDELFVSVLLFSFESCPQVAKSSTNTIVAPRVASTETAGHDKDLTS
jgi:hypothetical protein